MDLGISENAGAMAHLDQGYETQREFLEDAGAWLDLHLFCYYTRHQWLGPSSELKNMLGLVVSREEFEHNLNKASQSGLYERLDGEEIREIDLTERAIALRLKQTEKEFPILLLKRRLIADDFIWKCVLLACLAETDRKYERLFAYLQDDMTRRTPSVSLVCELFTPSGGDIAERRAFLRMKGVDSTLRKEASALRLFDAQALERDELVLAEEAAVFLSTGVLEEGDGWSLCDGAVKKPAHSLLVQQETALTLDRVLGAPEPCCVLLSGGPGSGKRFQIEHLMSRAGERCVFADLGTGDWQSRARSAALAADINGAYLCLFHLDRGSGAETPAPAPQAMAESLEKIGLLQNKRFFLSEQPIPAHLNTLTVEIELPELSEGERCTLFRSALADFLPPEMGTEENNSAPEYFTPEELAAKFRFSPRQIRSACEQAAGLARLNNEAFISSSLIHRCCYRQAVHRLGDLASFVPAGGDWKNIILPAEQLRMMRRAVDHVRWHKQVYDNWGFDSKVSYGRALAILFSGVPGTGKTMCARIIANDLNMEMYKINLSQIVSKYIGETEKNLRAVFQEAKKANCVLFFDECDALFGKRSEVKDAHDRNANVEVAYLLQQIEEYDGVCILATNLIGNIDAAFMRRMTFVIHFPFPDAAAREQIFRRMFPEEAPLEGDIDWSFLAGKFELSGGHIKNIVLSAAFMAAGDGGAISMRHLLNAGLSEMKKNDMVVVREQFREYAYLLDGDGR